MATFVSLVNWTDQGARAYQDSVDRAEAVGQLAKQMGGSIESMYWTNGPYDLVVTTEFPDDETASAFGLTVGGQGNVRTCTMRAYNADDMRGIIAKAG